MARRRNLPVGAIPREAGALRLINWRRANAWLVLTRFFRFG